MKSMKLINRRNGKQIKVGSKVKLGGEACWVYDIKPNDIGLERASDGVSWELVLPAHIGCYQIWT